MTSFTKETKTAQTDKFMQKKFFIENGIILFISFIIVLFSLYLPVTVYRQEEFSPISLGRPFPFIHQYQTYTPPLPWKTSISSLWEHPTQVLWGMLLIDVGLVYITLWLIWRVMINNFNKVKPEVNGISDNG